MPIATDTATTEPGARASTRAIATGADRAGQGSSVSLVCWLSVARIAYAVVAAWVTVSVYAAITGKHLGVIASFIHWDAHSYERIATQGYATPESPGFFPLFPLAERGLSHLIGLSPAALAISWSALPFAAWGILHLAERFTSRRAAVVATAAFVCNPVSIFLVAGYPETLFVALTAWTLIFCLDQRWLRAALLAGLASAVFPQAALLGAIVALCAVLADHGARGIARAAVLLVIGELGLVGFVAFCWHRYGTPFAITIAQHKGWHIRVGYPMHVFVADLESALGVGGFSQIGFRPFPHHVMMSIDALACLLGAAAAVFSIVLAWRDRRFLPLAVFLVVNVGVYICLSDVWGDGTARLLLDVAPLYVIGAVAYDRVAANRSRLPAFFVLMPCLVLAAGTEILFNLGYWVT